MTSRQSALLLTTAATLAMAGAQNAHAQSAATAPAGSITAQQAPPAGGEAPSAAADAASAPAETPQAEAGGGEIVVTASRVNRGGYEAPTPTTVLTSEQIKAVAPANLADFVNQLPALAGSVSPRSNNGTLAGGTGGANLLNLRNLGVNRSLVLLSGRRVAPATLTGAVDVNLLPTALVKQVDVVTGGASAAWGSDAVAGVVNFVLDEKFTGVKGEAAAGITERGDGSTRHGELTFGAPFAGGRGHFLVSGQIDTTGQALAGGRSWYRGVKLITNPAYTATNGQPQRAVLPGVGLSLATDNGLITAGPLRGTQFNADGLASAVPFNFGFVSGLQSAGGSAEDQGGRLEVSIPLNNKSVFGRASFELTPSAEAYAEASYGRSRANFLSVSFNRFGNLTIQRDNAFLDPAVAARMTTLGVTSLGYGTSNAKLGQTLGRNTRELTRLLGGLKGRFGGWEWNAYYQRGVSRIVSEARNNAIIANYTRAIDAVRTATGVACRVNADAVTTNDDPACVPYNPFGTGAVTDAQRAYVTGTARQDIRITQQVAAASVAGEPMTLWAGPVSLAAGAEYRKETFKAAADPISVANAFFTGNYKASRGSFDVKEAFAEAVIPLLKDAPLAKDLSFNGAVRLTDYSSSGQVTTWKAGVTYDVISSLRFRGTRSRDIRAPNLNDLFQGGQTTPLSIADGVTNSTYIASIVQRGNPGLKPEFADTLSFGAVVRPGFAPGLSLSADYFNIEIRDAIVVLAAQDLLNGCVSNSNPSFCQYVTRGAANLVTQIVTPGINLAQEKTAGVDAELTYVTGLGRLHQGWNGRLTVSGLVTYVGERQVNTGVRVFNYAGALSDDTAVPRWRGLLAMTYADGGASLTARARYIGAGVISNAYTARDIVDNHVPATWYADVFGSYRFGQVKAHPEVFFAAENLFGQAARATPPTIGATHLNVGTNGLIYDVLGRQYRVGFRFRL